MSDRIYNMLYPERRMVSASTIIGWANDEIANGYLEKGQEVPEHNLPTVLEAMELLSDKGVCTFTSTAFEIARRT